MSTALVPAESTAGIKHARAIDRVAAVEVEALGPQVEGETGYGYVYCHENESAGLTHCKGQG